MTSTTSQLNIVTATRLNAERSGTKWEPLTGRAIAVKFGHIPTEDLYYFLKVCKEAKLFGWYFFGALKARASEKVR